MAFSLPTGTEAELAAEYRNRAQQITAHAATLEDKQMQRWFLDIAGTYQRMAQHLESKFGVSRAVKVSEAQEATPQDIAAIVDPTQPPEPEPSEES